jgi:hypothetical protein
VVRPIGTGEGSAPAARGSSVVDRATREKAKRIVKITVSIAVVAGLGIWLIPLPFDDPPAIRKLVAAVLVGIGAAYLARIVVANMGEMVAESEGPAIREQGQPEPVLRLAGVDMREAALPGADLGRTELTGALLEGADLNAATLHASRLAGADLRESDLRQADLRLADLSGADLGEADLRGADLRGAQLDGAHLGKALYNEGTKWPDEVPPPEAEPAIDVSKADR